MSIEIFFCYAHEDENLRQGLEKQLRALKRQSLIDTWHDRNIGAGTEWEREIDKHLNTAQIILLLVSPDFMDSDYCYSKEMKRAIERHEQKEAKVIPVILRPVYWKGSPFGKLQALPTDAIPVTDPVWHNMDRAFFNVSEGVREVIEELVEARQAEEERIRKAIEEERERRVNEQALNNHKNPYLVVLSTDELIPIPLNSNVIIVGRTDPDLNIFPDIDFKDKSVARRHAYFSSQQGKITIEDLNSLHKTQLNGVVLTPYEERALIHGDLIRFGNIEARFELR